MTLRRRISLWWTDAPSAARLGAFLVLIFLALILFGCATTEGVQITIKPERAEQCKAAGGCGLVSEPEIAAMKLRAYRQGVQDASEAAAELLDSNGCRRGDT